MYKIMYNSMYKFIIIKIYSKHDTATNTVAFLIMHYILFATNLRDNTPIALAE